MDFLGKLLHSLSHFAQQDQLLSMLKVTEEDWKTPLSEQLIQTPIVHHPYVKLLNEKFEVLLEASKKCQCEYSTVCTCYNVADINEITSLFSFAKLVAKSKALFDQCLRRQPGNEAIIDDDSRRLSRHLDQLINSVICVFTSNKPASISVKLSQHVGQFVQDISPLCSSDKAAELLEALLNLETNAILLTSILNIPSLTSWPEFMVHIGKQVMQLLIYQDDRDKVDDMVERSYKLLLLLCQRLIQFSSETKSNQITFVDDDTPTPKDSMFQSPIKRHISNRDIFRKVALENDLFVFLMYRLLRFSGPNGKDTEDDRFYYVGSFTT
ncbi:hypothetical protein Ciccas_000951 [Cichlidogyrus casuarinus]|uniref:Uncharacterized protein n=1 Tax=Cichlidogyrus casuarinus TaxID=1844966 RepID=A0ABD2QPE2_9PLAT